MVAHIVVMTGGTVDLEWLRSAGPSSYFREKDTRVMAADKGLLYARQAGIPVDYILGDFDSLPAGILEEYENRGIRIRRYPPEKDYTDTHLALLWAMEEGAKRVTILGGLGSRFDHSFANIGLLAMLLEHGVAAEIIDPWNRIFMMDRTHSGQMTIRKEENTFISLIPYTEKVTGVTLHGFQYPLEDAVLTIGISRGISNELIGDEGTIQVKEGILLVSISKDAPCGN